MSRIKKIIETLEAERSDVQQRLEWLDGQLQEFREHHAEQEAAPAAPAAPAPAPRSKRRQTAKRASARRATARTVKRDVPADIIAFLTKHPQSTAGDVAKGLNLNRNSVATRLTQMTKAGEIVKAERGYSAPGPRS